MLYLFVIRQLDDQHRNPNKNDRDHLVGQVALIAGKANAQHSNMPRRLEPAAAVGGGPMIKSACPQCSCALVPAAAGAGRGGWQQLLLRQLAAATSLVAQLLLACTGSQLCRSWRTKAPWPVFTLLLHLLSRPNAHLQLEGQTFC